MQQRWASLHRLVLGSKVRYLRLRDLCVEHITTCITRPRFIKNISAAWM